MLTADQVVVWKGLIREKPTSEQEARAFIAGYGAAPPSTVGSCVITDSATRQQWHAVDVATVHFDPIPEAPLPAPSIRHEHARKRTRALLKTRARSQALP